MNADCNRENYQGRALRRLSEMGCLVEYAAAERELAAYYAHKAGVPIEEVARRAKQSADEIQAVIDSYSRAKDVPALDEECQRMLCPSHLMAHRDDPFGFRNLS